MSKKKLPSGIYQCTNCQNKVIHLEGGNFAPCSKCKTNNRWEMLSPISKRQHQT